MRRIRRILIVDDHSHDRTLVRLVLAQGFPDATLAEADGASSLAEQLVAGAWDAVVTGHALSWSDGAEVLAAAKHVDPDTVVVLFTASGNEDLAARALELGLDGYLVKDSAGYVHLPALLRGLLGRRDRRRAEQPFRRLAERIAIGAFTGRAGQGIVDANAAMARILGCRDAAELGGRDLAEFLEDPADRAEWLAVLRESRALPERVVQLRALGEETASIWARLQVFPAEDGSQGRGSGRYEGTLEDVSAQEQTRLDLASQTDALARTRKEVEELAYVVSHDLQAPLHLSSRYARRLAERCKGERLDEEALRCVRLVLSGTKRMQTLVDNVLELSRVGTRGRPFHRVELTRVVERAMDNLRLDVEASGASISFNGLPAVVADEAQLVQVFQNLLSNAIKFRGDEPPTIAIDAHRNGAGWVLSVKDDGIGIPPADHERIFEMFQRLHTVDEFPGTGIGLAICRRIASRHGGSIWVESAPRAGATFFLRLPTEHEEGPSEACPASQTEGGR